VYSFGFANIFTLTDDSTGRRRLLSGVMMLLAGLPGPNAQNAVPCSASAIGEDNELKQRQ